MTKSDSEWEKTDELTAVLHELLIYIKRREKKILKNVFKIKIYYMYISTVNVMIENACVVKQRTEEMNMTKTKPKVTRRTKTSRQCMAAAMRSVIQQQLSSCK